jgi:hypothetical protein
MFDIVQFTKVKDRLMGRSQPVFTIRTNELDFTHFEGVKLIDGDNEPLGRGRSIGTAEDWSPGV